jgi:hypothetical protein
VMMQALLKAHLANRDANRARHAIAWAMRNVALESLPLSGQRPMHPRLWPQCRMPGWMSHVSLSLTGLSTTP